jgi:hypothetical protein
MNSILSYAYSTYYNHSPVHGHLGCSQKGGTAWEGRRSEMGEVAGKESRRLNTVQILCTHVRSCQNDSYFKNHFGTIEN